MWKPCLVCNALDLEMISIFRHPKNLNCILKILLELEAKQDDYLCRECCIEVINAFDLKRNLHQPELHSPEVLTDLVTIKNEVKEEILPSGSEEIIDSKIDYGLLVVDDVTTDLVCEDLPLDNKLELKALLGTGANARDTSEAQKSIEHAANDESDATSRKETVSSSNALEVNIEPKREAEEDADSSQSGSDGFQEYYKKEKSVDLDDNVEIEPIGRTQDVVRAIKENVSTQKEIASLSNDLEGMVKEGHVCYECGLNFKRNYLLIKHKIISGHYVKKPFECSYCYKVYSKKTPYTKHLRIHTKPYVCSECGKRFVKASGLQTHIKMHTKPYMLPVQIRAHAQHKFYTCSECGKDFSELAELIRHAMTPYECLHCSKTFSTEPTYLSHVKTHTQETCICSHCSKLFKNKISLIVHSILVHRKEKKKECPFCSKTYTRVTSFKKHLRELHKHKIDE